MPISALFRNGKTHLNQGRFPKTPPCNGKTVRVVAQLLESCPKREAPECGPDTARGDDATHFFVLGIQDGYSGVSRPRLRRGVRSDCQGKPLMTRASFYKKFCGSNDAHRRPLSHGDVRQLPAFIRIRGRPSGTLSPARLPN